jgi:chitinase
MKIRFCLFIIALVILQGISQAQDQTPMYRVVGYYANWAIYSGYPVTQIAVDKLTHINYAFAVISPEGEVVSSDDWADTQFPYPGDNQPLKGNFHQLQVLKQQNLGLKTLIAVGGWTGSANFSDVALTAESRQRFAQSAVDFITRYGFDGIDIDWEFPTGGGLEGNTERPQDPENFVLLLQTLREQLNMQHERDGNHYLLTIALSAVPNAYRPLDWERIHPLLDWINVMTYDMNGWKNITDFNAPLYPASSQQIAIDTAIKGLLASGIPSAKLVIGLPFYGYSWHGVENTNNGLYQTYTGRGVEAASGDSTLPYRRIVELMLSGYNRFWDRVAQVPWLYHADERVMISYDDTESIAAKAAYVRDHELGGMMIWELSQDTPKADLLSAVYETLNKHR